MNPHSSSSRLPFGSNGVSPQNSRSISPDGPDSPWWTWPTTTSLCSQLLKLLLLPIPCLTSLPFGLGSSSSSHFTSGRRIFVWLGSQWLWFVWAGPSSTIIWSGWAIFVSEQIDFFLGEGISFVAGGTSSSSGSLLGSSPESIGAGSSSVIGETEGSSASGQASLSSSAESATWIWREFRTPINTNISFSPIDVPKKHKFHLYSLFPSFNSLYFF